MRTTRERDEAKIHFMSHRENASSTGRLNEDIHTEMTVLKHMQREVAMAACHQQQQPRSKFMIADIIGNGKSSFPPSNNNNNHDLHHHHRSTASPEHRTTPSPQPRDLSVYLQHHRSTPDNEEDSDCDSSECLFYSLKEERFSLRFMRM